MPEYNGQHFTDGILWVRVRRFSLNFVFGLEWRHLVIMYIASMQDTLVIITMTSHKRHVVSNHRSFDCFFNSLYRPTSKKHQRPHYCSFAREFTGDQWILRIKGQERGKSFHLMTLSWWNWDVWLSEYMRFLRKETKKKLFLPSFPSMRIRITWIFCQLGEPKKFENLKNSEKV